MSKPKKTIDFQVRSNLVRILKALEEKNDIHEELGEWMESAFIRILQGEEPNAVFSYNVKAGRPKDMEKPFKEWKQARAVINLQQEGDTLEVALEKVAPLYDVSESTIKRAWLKNHEVIELLREIKKPAPVKVRDPEGNVIDELDLGVMHGQPIDGER